VGVSPVQEEVSVITKVMVRERMATTEKDSHDWLKNTSKKRVNRDGGKAKLGERTYSWVCSSPKELCTGKYSSKVDSYAHGSPEDAMRCIRRTAKLLDETL
jgi:hypothetical protein